MYRQLDPAKIDDTITLLSRRVEERFPGSGLSRVCRELEAVIKDTEGRCRFLAAPMRWLRGWIGLAILLLVASLAASLTTLRFSAGEVPWVDLVQGVEAAINDVILIGLAVVFLITLEGRLKRKRALRGLHELRSLAHVIDMHQLTKDPERVLSPGPDTASSPKRVLTPFELTRYLDYCSEMLALTAKAAALYGQHLDDPAILASVNEIENLTTNLSQKIWQKIHTAELYRQGMTSAG